MVSWQAFLSFPSSSRAPRISLAPKTPFPFPFKRLPRRLPVKGLCNRRSLPLMVASWRCLRFELIVCSTQKRWKCLSKHFTQWFFDCSEKSFPPSASPWWAFGDEFPRNPFRRELRINSISIQCIPHRSTLSTRIIQFLDFLACSLKGFRCRTTLYGKDLCGLHCD